MKKTMLSLLLLIASSAAFGGSVIRDVTNATPAGIVHLFAGSTCPSGYLAMGTSAGTLNRTGYKRLFDAVGVNWGVGDGATTFGVPWVAADYSPLMAGVNAVGSVSAGEVKSHIHGSLLGLAGVGSYYFGAGGNGVWSGTDPAGGVANLAAGTRFKFCIKL